MNLENLEKEKIRDFQCPINGCKHQFSHSKKGRTVEQWKIGFLVHCDVLGALGASHPRSKEEIEKVFYQYLKSRGFTTKN